MGREINYTNLVQSLHDSHSAELNAENILILQDSGLADQYAAYIDGSVKRYGQPA